MSSLLTFSYMLGVVKSLITYNIESLIVELDLSKGLNFDFSLPLMVDFFGTVFCMCVILISFCVVCFSWYYMEDCKHFSWYMFLIKMFVMSMLIFVLIPSLIGMMLGWDGLGLISFLLVIFYDSKESLSSGVLTFFSNRLGDSLMIMVIMLMSASMSYSPVNQSNYTFSGVVSILLVMGSMTKSAQMPFVAWLPSAMAAPTPISALVHSSTLVTAGCFLLFRFSPMLDKSVYLFLGMVSVLSSIYSGICALFEWDGKKVVALSTLGQMGLIMFSISLGSLYVAFFHLICHALFKSLLFVCMGTVIHSFGGAQDIRFFSSVLWGSPVLSCYLTISVLSLVGFPFFSGFYSKDLIFEVMLMSDFSLLLLFLVYISLILSFVYSFRLLKCLIFSGENSSYNSSLKINDCVMWPCSVLCFGSVFCGFFMEAFIIELNFSMVLGLKFWLLLMSPMLVSGILLSILEKKLSADLASFYKSNFFWDFFVKKWFSNELSSGMIENKVKYLSTKVESWVESGYCEWLLGSEMVWKNTGIFSKKVLISQSESLGTNFIKGLVLLFSVLALHKLVF